MNKEGCLRLCIGMNALVEQEDSSLFGHVTLELDVDMVEHIVVATFWIVCARLQFISVDVIAECITVEDDTDDIVYCNVGGSHLDRTGVVNIYRFYRYGQR